MKHPDVWKAVAEPTLFMDVKFTVTTRFFATRRRAFKWARLYLAVHPHGKVQFYQGKRRSIRLSTRTP